MAQAPGPASPVVALVGPTGSGKSAIALEAAQALAPQVELVAVDAFTVYRRMDVGTDKPGPGARARVPHHGIDLLDPSEECSVAWFQQQARTAIDAIHRRGRVPLLVGGSGLYFRAVVDPLAFPPTDPDVRERVHAEVGGQARRAHERLQRVDPDAAARIDPDNLRRSVRALEVHALTGQPFSAWRTAWERYESRYDDLVVIGLHRAPEDLAAAIASRVRGMLAAGLVAEARALALRPVGLSTTARQAIGYAEALAAVARRPGTADEEGLVETIARRTRRFAARQRRWFRRDPRVRWEGGDDAARAVRTALERAVRAGQAPSQDPASP